MPTHVFYVLHSSSTEWFIGYLTLSLCYKTLQYYRNPNWCHHVWTLTCQYHLFELHTSSQKLLVRHFASTQQWLKSCGEQLLLCPPPSSPHMMNSSQDQPEFILGRNSSEVSLVSFTSKILAVAGFKLCLFESRQSPETHLESSGMAFVESHT